MRKLTELPGIFLDPYRPTTGVRRVLFYGGCHAEAFARIFRKYCADPGVAFDIAINFAMIKKGLPFPYDHVGEWTDIVFSPIGDKANYNTSNLVDACSKSGVSAHAYPWLEWRGYHPFSLKKDFAGGAAWTYPRMVDSAPNAPSQEAHYRGVDQLFDRAGIFDNLQRTTERLKGGEEKHGCSIRVADFISENFTKERLFLTPDHPAHALYRHCVMQISKLLRLDIEASFYASAIEPQEGISFPIAPRVIDVLGLTFAGADYQSKISLFKDRKFDWKEFAGLCYGHGRGFAVYEAKGPTVIKTAPSLAKDLAADGQWRVPAGTQMLVGTDGAMELGHLKADVAWADTAIAKRLSAWESVYLFAVHWQRGAAMDLQKSAAAIVNIENNAITIP